MRKLRIGLAAVLLVALCRPASAGAPMNSLWESELSQLTWSWAAGVWREFFGPGPATPETGSAAEAVSDQPGDSSCEGINGPIPPIPWCPG